jgi:Domain of unknown function DUF29
MSQANKLADFEAVHSDVSSDYYSWLLGQAAALRSRRHDLLDWDKLAEELESMAVSEERELLSQLKRLFVHLLKLQYQSRKRSRSWENSIDDARERVGDLLAASPSIRNKTVESPEFLDKAYVRARRQAGREMHLDEQQWDEVLPKSCPWTSDQFLSDRFWPKPE